jgi:hypothetical protein
LILGDIGSPAVMREQLDKLAGLAREPGVMIQILPFTASTTRGRTASRYPPGERGS